MNKKLAAQKLGLLDLLILAMESYLTVSCIFSNELRLGLTNASLRQKGSQTSFFIFNTLVGLFGIEKILEDKGTTIIYGYFVAMITIGLSVGVVFAVNLGAINIRERIRILFNWRFIEVGLGISSIGLRLAALNFFNTMTCKSITINSYVSSKNYINLDIIDTYNEQGASGESAVLLTKDVSSLSNDIDCGSVEHWLIGVISLLITILYFVLALLSSKFRLQEISSSSFSLPRSRQQITYVLSLTMIAITNQVILKIYHISDTAFDTIVRIEIVLCIFTYVVVNISIPDFSRAVTNQIRWTVFVLTSLLSYVMLIELISNSRFGKNIYESIIVILLTIPLVLKIHLKIQQIANDNHITMNHIVINDKYTRDDILHIYFMLVEVITEFNRKKYVDLQFLRFLLIFKKSSDLSLESERRTYSDNYKECLVEEMISSVSELLKNYTNEHPGDKIMFMIYVNCLIELKSDFCMAIILIRSRQKTSDRIEKMMQWEVNLLKRKLKHIADTHQIYSHLTKVFRDQIVPSNLIMRENLLYSNILNFAKEFHYSNKLLDTFFSSISSLLLEVKGKARLSRIDKNVSAASKLKIHLDNLIERLDRAAKNRFSPLLLMRIIYEKEINSNERKTRELIALVKERNWNENLYCLTKEHLSSELIVFVVGGEQSNFHRILEVYGETGELGYTKIELLNEDLNIIIPQSFKSMHPSFLQKTEFENGLLEMESLYNAFVLNKSQHLSYMKMKIIMDFDYHFGLRFIGYMIKQYSNTDNDLFCIVNQDGIVEDSSATISKLVRRGMTINKIHPSLKVELNMMNNALRSTHSKSYKQIVEDSYLRECWAAYISWTKGKIIRINIGYPKTVLVKVEEFIFKSEQLRWVITLCDLIHGVESNIKRKEFDKFPMVKKGVIFEQFKLIIDNFKHTESLIDHDKPDEYLGNPCKIDESIAHNELSHKINISNSEFIIDEKIDRISKPIELLSSRSNKIREENLSESSSNSNSNKIIEEYNIAKFDEFKEIEKSLDGCELQSLQDRFERRIDTQSRVRQKSSIIIQVIMLGTFILVTIYSFAYSRYRAKVVGDSNLEAYEQLQTCDRFSWAMQSQQVNVFFLESCRMVKNGVFPNDFLLDVGGVPMYEACMNNLTAYGAYQLNIDLMISQKVSEIRFPSLLTFDWQKTEIEVLWFSQNINKEIEWSKQNYSRSQAITFVHGFNQRFVSRNYENDSSIVEFEGFNEEERKQDPDEYMYRYNLQNNLNKEYAFRSYDYYEYLKNVVKYQEYVIVREVIVIALVLCVYLASLMLVYSYEIYKLNLFYSDLFNQKVILFSSLG